MLECSNRYCTHVPLMPQAMAPANVETIPRTILLLFTGILYKPFTR